MKSEEEIKYLEKIKKLKEILDSKPYPVGRTEAVRIWEDAPIKVDVVE